MHMAVPKGAHLPLDCSRKSTEFGLRNSAGKKDDGGLSWILKYRIYNVHGPILRISG
jgi:hypothetical protein